MNKEKFIEAIRIAIIDNSVSSVQTNLIKLAGRKPQERLKAMSNWYHTLNDIDKNVVMEIVKESVETAVFGFLCVLDGVRQIENEDKGKLILYYEKGEDKIFLNDPHSPGLHEFL